MALPNSRRIFDMGAYMDTQLQAFQMVGLYEFPSIDAAAGLEPMLPPEGYSPLRMGRLWCAQSLRPDFDEQARRIAGPTAHSYGRYLCEFCFDVLTDKVLPAEQSETGLEMAWCGCTRERDANADTV